MSSLVRGSKSLVIPGLSFFLLILLAAGLLAESFHCHSDAPFHHDCPLCITIQQSAAVSHDNVPMVSAKAPERFIAVPEPPMVFSATIRTFLVRGPPA
jgi:hypothetical protein